MKTRIIALLLGLLMVASIVGACGTEAPSQSDPEQSESSQVTESTSVSPSAEKIVIGYACFNATDPFHAKVSAGVQAEATARGYDIVIVDNQFDAATAVENVDDLLARGVDIIIESTRDAKGVGLAIKEKCDAASVPLISVDTGIPGTPFFGTDNVTAGGQGGEFLANEAVKKWGENPVIDLFISLEAPTAGDTNENRMKAGFIDHALAIIDIPEENIFRVQGNTIESAMQYTEDIINAHPDAEHILIAGFVDAAGQGAEAAIEKMNLIDKTIICTVEFTDLAVANFDKGEGNTAWIGAVATTPEKYGYYLFNVLDEYFQNGAALPDEWYVESQIATFDNYSDILTSLGQ
jgi:ABC-type sugar transport system, periplasmic component